jgi:hypothetical protein
MMAPPTLLAPQFWEDVCFFIRLGGYMSTCDRYNGKYKPSMREDGIMYMYVVRRSQSQLYI